MKSQERKKARSEPRRRVHPEHGRRVFVAMSPHKSLRDLAGQAGGTKTKVFVAMSGGVDSSVTAALLKEQGFDVRGVHIKMWSDPSIPCTFKEDRYDAMKVAAHLDIPFETWDLTKEYKKEVVEYMIREYALGRTPNPDVMCNRHIKFGIFLKHALAKGADFVATGHYVRRIPSGMSFEDTQKFPSEEFFSVSSSLVSPPARHRARSSERGLLKTYPRSVSLFMANDSNKDQSYFLWTLTQDQLKHCMFPLGEFIKGGSRSSAGDEVAKSVTAELSLPPKPTVREMAKKFGLPTAEKPDSQGICFIGEINLREFLKNHISVASGPVLTTSGKKVGEHEGLAFYTIGQRQGIGIGGGIPFYVVEKDFSQNALIVAEGPYDEKLFRSDLHVTDVHWISGKFPKLPFYCEARIRYRQPLQRCKVVALNTGNQLLVTFDEPQRAVTSGQSAVFYKKGPFYKAQGGEMLGGGIIT